MRSNRRASKERQLREEISSLRCMVREKQCVIDGCNKRIASLERDLTAKVREINEASQKEHMAYVEFQQVMFWQLFYVYAEYSERYKRRFELCKSENVVDRYIAEGKLTQLLTLIVSMGLTDTYISWVEMGKNFPNTLYKYKKDVTNVLITLKARNEGKVMQDEKQTIRDGDS